MHLVMHVLARIGVLAGEALLTFWLLTFGGIVLFLVWVESRDWLRGRLRMPVRGERRSAAALPQRTPRDPAGWGWIRPEEQERFEAIVSAEATGSEGQ